MEYKGKYKEWYDRLVLANCNEKSAINIVDKFIQKDSDEFWEETIEKFIKDGVSPNEAIQRVVRIRKLTTGFDSWESTVKGVEFTRKEDLEFLKKAIPKEELEDGAWYDCEECAKSVARFGGKAQWNEKMQMFLAPGQQQFGMDGYLDHWADVVDTRVAGFVPMWKVEN